MKPSDSSRCAILLEDRERQLGERLAHEVVDARLEHIGHRAEAVAVEALPAPDADRHDPVVAAPPAGLRGSAGQAELRAHLIGGLADCLRGVSRRVEREVRVPLGERAAEVAVLALHEAEEEVRVGILRVGGDGVRDELLALVDSRSASPV